MKKIIVIFKTHLDVGYTDLAANVKERYNREFVPKAIAVGKRIREIGRSEGFVWTTGSWLLHQYLEQAAEQEARLCREAIREGILRWHALPFTLHSEYAGTDLYRYGLTLSKDLDEEFGITTIAGKCTDVPGHTKGIVPILSRAGVQLIHIGTNGGCVVPQLPQAFRWLVAEEGEEHEVIVVYNDGYGGTVKIPGSDIGFYIAHTTDNSGPPTAREVLETFDKLHEEYPGAKIAAGTLDDMAEQFLKIKDTLPIVTNEIGDTWINGTASDPQKSNRYRAILREAQKWDDENRAKAYRHLLMIPEHTWGLDEKTYMNDKVNFSKEDFNAIRKQEKCLLMEKSWNEQRAYLDAAVQELSEPYRSQAEITQKEYCIPYPDPGSYKPVDSMEARIGLQKNGWSIAFDDTGAVKRLEKDGVAYADDDHHLGTVYYEVSCKNDIASYLSRYCTLNDWWIWGDYGKDGIPEELKQAATYYTEIDHVFETGQGYLVLLKMEEEANVKYGFPGKAILFVNLLAEKAVFDFAWFEKPALRLPESIWLGFNPIRPLTGIQKLNTWVDPKEVVSGGGREMHATSGLINFDGILLNTIDEPVFSVDKPNPYGFYNQIPACDKGIWLNLYNNHWGVNFRMWYEEDARFRVELSAR